jgi:hypothetical protein
MERIIHSNDNGREAKATIWIFEGSSLYVLIAAFALPLAGFRYCYDALGLGTWVSLLVGVAPLVVAFRSFAVRVMRAIAGTGLLFIRFELHGLSARKNPTPVRRMNIHIPDCYSVDDLLVFGDISHGVICQGINLSMPDQSNVGERGVCAPW